MAFVTILTRHLPARRALLERQQLSLRQQSDADYTQRVLVDEQARGFLYSWQMLIEAAKHIADDYVLILDDDDYILETDAIAILKLTAEGAPPVIIFKGGHAELGVLPRVAWGERPVMGDIGSFDFILRADVFRACVGAPTDTAYAHDYAIIAEAYDRHAEAVVWLDAVLCGADKRRIGQEA